MGTLLGTQLGQMVLGAALATWYGPFADAEGFAALLTDMILVAAMAIQNAMHRAHLASAPPSTVMTSTTTQIMLDLGDLVHGLAPAKASAIKVRLTQMTISAVAFALGCTLGALLYAWLGVRCFWIPPLLVLAMLSMRHALAEADRHNNLAGSA